MAPKCRREPRPSLRAIRTQELPNWLSDCDYLETFRRAEGSIPIAAPWSRGLKHFQARHGLATAGKLDAATLRELNTPLSARVQQIDDALERWRWLPIEFQQPPVLVNIPEFRLRAFSADRQLSLTMNVVVGKAAPTQ